MIGECETRLRAQTYIHLFRSFIYVYTLSAPPIEHTTGHGIMQKSCSSAHGVSHAAVFF